MIGKLSNLLGASTNPAVMRYSFLVSPISCLLAALILYCGSRMLEKTKRISVIFGLILYKANDEGPHRFY